MGSAEPERIDVRIDDDVRKDLERAHVLTGITSRADLVRHAIKKLVQSYDGATPERGRR